jgi:hypothetical protein
MILGDTIAVGSHEETPVKHPQSLYIGSLTDICLEPSLLEPARAYIKLEGSGIRNPSANVLSAISALYAAKGKQMFSFASYSI